MPAPGFGALFEVSTETFGLCVACIGGAGFGCRSAMKRNGGMVHLSGLGASLLTAFYCLYGLTYWFNGIQGYSCESLSTVMRSCLCLSQGLALMHLFMKSDAINCKTPSWMQYRWLGLLLTAVHWGAMAACVIFDVNLGGEGVIEGLDGLRCLSGFGSVSQRVKWVAAWCSQLFQTVAFIHPLQCHLIGTARVRLGSGKRRSNWPALVQTPLWRGVIAVACSLAVTTIIAGFSLAKSFDRVPHMPVFAVEVLVNVVNLAAIYFAVQVDYPKIAPKYPPRNGGQLLAIPNKHRRNYCYGYGDFYHGGGIARPGPGYGRRPWRGDSRFVMVSTSPRPHYVDPTTKRLPPVIDASPEVSAANSPELGIREVRGGGLEGRTPIGGRIGGINANGGGEMIARDELAHPRDNVGTTLLLASHPQLSLHRPRQSGTRPRTYTYPAVDKHRLRSSNTDGTDTSSLISSMGISSTPTTTTVSGTDFSITTVIPEVADHNRRELAVFTGVPPVNFHPTSPPEHPVAFPSPHHMMEEEQSASDTRTVTIATAKTDPSSRTSSAPVRGTPTPGRTAGTPTAGGGDPTSAAGVFLRVHPPDTRGTARRNTMTERSISPGSVALDGWDGVRSPTTSPSAQTVPSGEPTGGLLGYWKVESGTGDGCVGAHEEEVKEAAPTEDDLYVGAEDRTVGLSSKVDAADLRTWWALPGQGERKSQRGQRGENVKVEGFATAARDVEDDFGAKRGVPATTTTSFAGGFAHAFAVKAAAAFSTLAGIGGSTPRKSKTTTSPLIRATPVSAFSVASPLENSDCASRFSDDRAAGETRASGSKKQKTPLSAAVSSLPSSAAVAARSGDREGRQRGPQRKDESFQPFGDFTLTAVEPVSPLAAPAITVQSPSTFLVNIRE